MPAKNTKQINYVKHNIKQRLTFLAAGISVVLENWEKFMSDQDTMNKGGSPLGEFLADIRSVKGMTLRQVEEATNKEVSNAYLSQIEKGAIKQPSPNILHSLASVYGVPYEKLMEMAGHILTGKQRKSLDKHGRLATFASANLTDDEEEALLEYLKFLRTRRGGKNKT